MKQLREQLVKRQIEARGVRDPLVLSVNRTGNTGGCFV
jgi:hypothetical protein